VNRWVLGPGAVAAGRDIKGPVNVTIISGRFERLRDAIFDARPLAVKLGLDRFVGREWLIKQIDDYIGTHRSGYVVIQGEAGVGKSALAAHLVWTRPCVHHFTQLEGGRSPEQARRSLAAQLIGAWGLADEFTVGDAFPAGADRPDWLLKVLHAAADRRDQSNPGYPLVLVVDGLDESDPPVPGHDTGIPLGLPLPEHLPDRVFVVATSRLGQPMPALYEHVSWHILSVDDRNNLKDMSQYVGAALTRLGTEDKGLLERIDAEGISKEWFIKTLLDRCAGIWIYLRYVLEAIADGRLHAAELGALPHELSGYYIKQVHRWALSDSWPTLGLPVLATLAALHRRVDRADLSLFAGVSDGESLRRWLDEQLRPFLDVTHDSNHRRQYYIRHESLRELFRRPDRVPGGDAVGIADVLYAALRDANDRIVTALVPPLVGGRRNWRNVDGYTRFTLPEHAAASHRLDELVVDAGFLLCVEPAALMRWRTSLTTERGLVSLAAFQLNMGYSSESEYAARAWWLHVWARKASADSLAESAAGLSSSSWVVGRAWWSGTAHQALKGHQGWVMAVAVGQDDENDQVVSGSVDGTVRIWDIRNNTSGVLPTNFSIVTALAMGKVGGSNILAVASGSRITIWSLGQGRKLDELTANSFWNPIAVGELDGKDVVAFGGEDGDLRIWDLNTSSYLATSDNFEEGISALAIGTIGNRDVVVTGGKYNTLRIWNGDGQTSTISFPGLGTHGLFKNYMVSAVATGQIGGVDVVVAGGMDGAVRLWDPSGQLDPLVLQVHDFDVCSLAIRRIDGRDVVVSAGHHKVRDGVALAETGSIRVWDPLGRSPEPSVLFDYPLPGDGQAGGNNGARSMAVGRLSHRDVVVFGGDDKVVRILNLGGPAEVASRSGHRGGVSDATICLLEGREVIVTSGGDGALHIIDVRGAAEPIVFSGHDRPVLGVAAGRVEGEDVIVSVDIDRAVRIWSLERGAHSVLSGPWQISRGSDVLDIMNHMSVKIGRLGGANRIIISDNSGVYVFTRDGSLLWMNGLPGEKNMTVGQFLNREVVVIASGNHVQVWAPVTDQRATLISDKMEKPDCLAFGQFGGRNVIVIGDTDRLRIWDIVNGVEIGDLASYHGRVWKMEFVEVDGENMLVTAGADSVLRIWKLTGNTVDLVQLVGHVGPIDALAVGRIGGRSGIVTGHRDGTTLLWYPHDSND
jgi:WD40 repeat protein